MAKEHFKVRFSRVTASDDDGNHVEIGSIDWKKLLEDEAKLGIEDRKLVLDKLTYAIEPRDTGSRHLAMHKLKDGNEYVSMMNPAGGFEERMAVDNDGNHMADTSCVVFKEDTNVFGLVLGNQSSPRAGRVARWLTERDPLGSGLMFHAVPLRLRPLTRKLTEAHGARWLDITVPVAELAETGISISTDVDDLATGLPDAMVTIKVSYGNRRPRHAEGTRLLSIAKAVAGVVTGADRAKVGVYQEVPSKGRGKRRREKTILEGDKIDLVHHEIAHEFRLSVADGEVSIDRTLVAIDEGFTKRASELRAALEGDDDGDQTTSPH